MSMFIKPCYHVACFKGNLCDSRYMVSAATKKYGIVINHQPPLKEVYYKGSASCKTGKLRIVY